MNATQKMNAIRNQINVTQNLLDRAIAAHEDMSVINFLHAEIARLSAKFAEYATKTSYAQV